MPARTLASRFSRTAVAGAFALALPLAGLAQERTSGATLIVTVFADRYVADDVSFTDLDALDTLARPMNSTVVRLDGCGPAANDALLAAAKRLRDFHLELRTLAESDPPCAVASTRAVRVSRTVGSAAGLRPVAHSPSDPYWRSVMP
jgi:hypothetical protein